jgi:hypothetical protein
LQAIRSNPENMLNYKNFKERLTSEALFRKTSEHDSQKSAFTAKIRHKMPKKCYFCGKIGHLKINCYKYNNQNNLNKTESTTHALLATENDVSKDCWILDSGASDHMCHNEEHFTSMKKTENVMITLADGKRVKAYGKGTVVLISNISSCQIHLTNVLYVPDLKRNLISLSVIDTKGYNINVSNGNIFITKTSKTLLSFKLLNGIYIGYFIQMGINCLSTARITTESMEDWHKKMGHLNYQDLRQLTNIVDGANLSGVSRPAEKCETCILAKLTRYSFSGRNDRDITTDPNHVVSADLGFVSLRNITGETSFVTYTHHGTGASRVYLLHKKSDQFKCFEEYLAEMKTQYNVTVKVLKCDGAGEFVNQRMKDLFKEKGIMMETSTAYTPEQNAVAERKNRTLVECCRAMLIESGLNKNLWGYALMTAAYLKNRSPSSVDKSKTPIELLSKKKPNLSNLRFWGEECWKHVPKERRQKLDNKAIKCNLIGYTHNGYLVKEIDSNRIHRSCHIVFQVIKPQKNKTREILQRISELDKNSSDTQISSESENEDFDRDFAKHEKHEKVDNRRYPRRDRRQPEPPEGKLLAQYWKKEKDLKINPYNKMNEDLKRNTQIDKIEPNSHANLVIKTYEPNDYDEAIKSKEKYDWQKAMEEEYKSLIQNNTWTLVDMAPMNIIDCKWVFKRKRDKFGNVVRYKARLVAKGFTQIHGVDYEETFSPVVKFATLRVILSIVAIENLECHQLDVKTAFLNGDITEELYMYQPRGFVVDGEENKICKLNKAIYGLKQASRSWFLKLDNFLLKIGFKRCTSDYGLYVKQNELEKNFLLVYVDDILLITKDVAKMDEIKAEFFREFDMVDLGEISVFLNWEIKRDREKKNFCFSKTVSKRNNTDHGFRNV